MGNLVLKIQVDSVGQLLEGFTGATQIR